MSTKDGFILRVSILPCFRGEYFSNFKFYNARQKWSYSPFDQNHGKKKTI